jgi:hypothetical protein
VPDAEGLEGMFCFASQARFAASSAHMPTCNGECTKVRGRCHIVVTLFWARLCVAIH